MQFNSSLFALAATFATLLTAHAAAAPRAEEVAARSAEVDGHIYICTEGNYTGDCTDYGFDSGVCTNFPSDFDKQISSMGPDQGWFCVTFTSYNCDYSSGETYTVTYPGFSSLPSGIDNNLSSIVCYSS